MLALSPALSSITIELSRDSTFQGQSPRIATQVLYPSEISTSTDHNASPDDSDLQSLGDLLQSQGRYKSAEDTFRKLAAMQRQKHGEESGYVVAALQRLGETLLSQGRASEAEKILWKARSLCLRLDPESLDQQGTRELNLGWDSLSRVISYQGRPEEARQLHLKALGGNGGGHAGLDPENVAHCLGLADACRLTGRLDEATSLYTQLLEDSRSQEVEKHFPKVQALSGLAITHGLQRQFDDAIKYAAQALEQVQHRRGPEHPNTLARQDDLAAMYCQTGHLNEANRLCQDTYGKKKRVLGEDHPETLLNRQIAVNILLRRGLVDEAESMCEQVLEKQKLVFDAGHPRVVASMLMLVDVWKAQGRDGKALSLFERCVRMREEVLPEHPNTKAMAEDLEAWKSRGGVDGVGEAEVSLGEECPKGSGG